MVFTSATTPAPPEGSKPAIVSTTGGDSFSVSFIIPPRARGLIRRPARVQVLDEMHRPREGLSVREEPYRGNPFGPRRATIAQVPFPGAAERDKRKRHKRVCRLFQTFESGGRAVHTLRRRVEDWAEDRE